MGPLEIENEMLEHLDLLLNFETVESESEWDQIELVEEVDVAEELASTRVPQSENKLEGL